MNQCKKGGYVIRRHDRVVRWLAGWIEDRVGSQVLVEQSVAADGEEEGRLDLTLESGGRRLWLDVAIVNVMTINAGGRLRRAKLDGAAARREEGAKRSRYRGLATPFVIEAHGRGISLGQLSGGLLGTLSSGTLRMSLWLGNRFLLSFSPGLPLSSSRRAPTRRPIGTTQATISSSLSFCPTKAAIVHVVECRHAGQQSYGPCPGSE